MLLLLFFFLFLPIYWVVKYHNNISSPLKADLSERPHLDGQNSSTIFNKRQTTRNNKRRATGSSTWPCSSCDTCWSIYANVNYRLLRQQPDTLPCYSRLLQQQNRKILSLLSKRQWKTTRTTTTDERGEAVKTSLRVDYRIHTILFILIFIFEAE